jgi:bifunctional UDP-N-acetylglucosamine pyrophosphorylase/glucosamine-1-phosphate N-acetyltransferase
MKAVILAAGKSTRTYPLTLTRPKPLLPVANRSILEHQLDALPPEVTGAVLIVGYKHEMIRAHLGDRYGRIAIEYVVQTEQRGTGHAVGLAEPHVDGPFLAMNGDDIYAAEDLAAVAAVAQGGLAKVVADPRLYGIYEVDAEMQAVRLVEKPVEVFSNLANIGAYKFTPEIFEILRATPPSERGEIEITSAIQALADRRAYRVVEAQRHWLPIGYAWHLIDANAYLLDNLMHAEILGEVHPAAHLQGRVSIGRGTVVRPGVVIDGPVCIGDHCEIGPNCWLRPGTTLGHHCKVGQGSEIKNSVVFNRSKVPHLSYVGDSVIGEGCNLGCGTITANLRHDGKNHRSVINGSLVDTGRRKFGAIFGDGVHTGIHTSIYPGRKFWPGTGTAPGEVVREDKTG